MRPHRTEEEKSPSHLSSGGLKSYQGQAGAPHNVTGEQLPPVSHPASETFQQFKVSLPASQGGHEYFRGHA